MATPAMLASSFSMQVIPNNAGSVRINTLDGAGAALDVSTGFTIVDFNVDVSSGQNPLKTAQDISANFTPAFDETGVTLSWTAAQAATIAAALPSLNCVAALLISDDSGTTASLAAQGSITLQAAPYLS